MAAVVALVAGGLTLALRPAANHNVLTASSGPGGPLFGTSVSDRSWLAQSTRRFGHLAIIRTNYAGLPAKNVWTTGPANVNESAVLVSFNAAPSRVLSGADDAALAAFFDTAPSGRDIYYSFDSKPETAVRAREFTTSQYKAAWAHVVGLARKAHNSFLKPTLTLQSSDLSPRSGVAWTDYLPAHHIIQTLAWFAYPAGTPSGHYPQLTPPARFMGRAVAASDQAHLPYGFAGFGLATASGRPG